MKNLFKLLLVLTAVVLALPEKSQAETTPIQVPKVYSPENYSQEICFGKNGASFLPSDKCGCEEEDICGVCGGDGSSCAGCNLVDCNGKTIPDSAKYCPLDVNKDGTINSKDANEVKDYLNNNHSGTLNNSNSHLDVTLDKLITPNDMLQIINFINSPPSGFLAEDECGVCGGPGKNSCGKCFGAPDFAVDIGCGCGIPSANSCGCDPKIIDLGCGCGKSAPGACGCDPTIQDLGCGCGNPAPSGCDNICGSTASLDDCGVCGGDGTSCIEPCTAACGCLPDGTPVSPNECGECGSLNKDQCGRCPGTSDYNTPPGTCGCDPAIKDLGCGCGKPAPSGCDKVCGSTAILDACDVCGGDGTSCIDKCKTECGCDWNGNPHPRDECGNCGSTGKKNACGTCDPNFVDLGCGCGYPAPGPCGCGIQNQDRGCGCGKPGPSGCDKQCGSTKVEDACGVCGGPGGKCCDYYTLSAAYPDENVYAHAARFMSSIVYGTSYDLFSGEGAKLSCLDKLVDDAVTDCYNNMKAKNAGSSILFPLPASHYCEPSKVGGVYKTNAYWFGDDNFYSTFFDYDFYRLAGQISTNQQFKSDYDQMMYYAQNSDHDRDTAYHRSTKKLNAKYMDKNCKLISGEVDKNKICGDLKIDALISPISLQWNQDDLSIDTKLVNFKINPHSQHSFYEWKASSKFPLLVYDINKNGIVDDATELLGNWTMGGKKSSSITSKDTDTGPWANGFEALAFFDSNLDGKVETNELDELSLWFDNNQDGKTDKDELFPIRSKGVSTLYYEGIDNSRPEKDIVLSRGFQRIINGKTIVGKSIDWYSKGYDSELEAFRTRATEATFQTLNIDNQSIREGTASEPLALKKNFNAGVLNPKDRSFGNLEEVKNPKTNFSGAWNWTAPEAKMSVLNTGGLLGIVQDGSVILGSSVTETPLVLPPSKKDEVSNLRSTLVESKIIGKVFQDKSGKECLRFSTLLKDQKNESLVYLSDDGKTLLGETIGEISKGEKELISIRYKWKAKLLPMHK